MPRKIPGIKQRFYVYTLSDERDGRVFYVGKGSGNRIYNHQDEARSGHACYKCMTIRMIWNAGFAVNGTIVHETEQEEEALQYERDLVAEYGIENLCNVHPGGAGLSKRLREIRRNVLALEHKKPTGPMVLKGRPPQRDRPRKVR